MSILEFANARRAQTDDAQEHTMKSTQVSNMIDFKATRAARTTEPTDQDLCPLMMRILYDLECAGFRIGNLPKYAELREMALEEWRDREREEQHALPGSPGDAKAAEWERRGAEAERLAKLAGYRFHPADPEFLTFSSDANRLAVSRRAELPYWAEIKTNFLRGKVDVLGAKTS